MATRVDVAKLAGVSPSTVSRVLNDNGYVAAEVRERVQKAIRELNYIPNRMARSLKLKACRQFACVIPSISNPFYHEVAMGIEETALEHGYTFSLYNMTSEKQEYFKLVLEGFYDGLIFLSPFEVEQVLSIEEISRHIPTSLYCDHRISYVVPHVYVNLKRAMKRNVEALIHDGHEKILYLGQEWDLQLDGSRYQGYITSMNESNLEVLPYMTQLVPNLRDTLTVGYERTKSLVSTTHNFTAIVASNDLLAVGAIRALTECGIRVPEDVSVTGIDDVEIARLMTPTLTTTRIPKREIGHMLVTMLLDQISHEYKLETSCEFNTEIIFRESTSYNRLKTSCR